MATHRITYVEIGPFEFAARCTCRKWATPKPTYRTVQMCEDEANKHLDLVERVRVHLAWGRAPSLKAERDYYLDQAANPDEPAEQRQLWKQLASEISYRLNDGVSTEEQTSLF